MRKLAIVLIFLSLVVVLPAQTNFHAVPLIDVTAGNTYLHVYSGQLYENSNNPPSDHDVAGRAAAARVQPLDVNGRPSTNGKVVVISIGMSNMTMEFCSSTVTGCSPVSFIGMAAASRQVDHQRLVLVDCAKGSQVAKVWVDDQAGNYSTCQQRLAVAGVTEKQVQVILYKDANARPQFSLTPTTVCSSTSSVDACIYEFLVGQTARFVKTRYPNVQQMFLHSRIYAGYAAPGSLNPEPFAFEYGLATKWLIEAQIVQNRTGQVDPTAGNLSKQVAPWLGWGPYYWASGSIPRKDGVSWVPSDFGPDMTHPSPSGITKVANQLMNFYLTSPYSPWFRASGG